MRTDSAITESICNFISRCIIFLAISAGNFILRLVLELQSVVPSLLFTYITVSKLLHGGIGKYLKKTHYPSFIMHTAKRAIRIVNNVGFHELINILCFKVTSLHVC